MVALIIITGIVLYVFVGIVAYHVGMHKIGKSCGCNNDSYKCDHEFTAFMLSLVWPVGYIVWALGVGLYRAGIGVADFLTKER